MNAAQMDNDTRGWVLTGISALACILGASVIFIDVCARVCLPKKRQFDIKDSNTFLSCSLSLSGGVMLFSALYKMLPSSKRSLQEAGFSPSQAAWILMGFFLGGVFGIQIISRICHRYMPSHTVDCDHTHEDEGQNEEHGHNHSHSHQHDGAIDDEENKYTESTPLLKSSTSTRNSSPRRTTQPEMSESPQSGRRPSIHTRMSSTVSKLVSGQKESCDGDGPCFGYSSPCGKECFKNINSRGGLRSAAYNSIKRPTAALRHSTAGIISHSTIRPMSSIDEEASLDASRPFAATSSNARKYSDTALPSIVISDQPNPPLEELRPQASQSSLQASQRSLSTTDHDIEANHDDASGPVPGTHTADPAQRHHHHVPQNAFLSISLQTSIAIALHKLPEGIITYATNHANPKLGFTVFMALAIHNVSEGFALALPLYLSTNSRIKALLYSILLGGFSQPLGAGIAALYLHFSEKGRGGQNQTDEQQGVYGGMYALTAGIMASVALSLLQEGNELGHNKGLAMVFAFIGMGILGMSTALTG